MESRLIRIEDTIKKIKKECNGPFGLSAGKGGTWAQVAQNGVPVIRRLLAAITGQRPTVRVRMMGIEGKTPSEILAEVNKSISGAYAMKPLRSAASLSSSWLSSVVVLS